MNIVIVGINSETPYNLAPALLKSYCLKDPFIRDNARIILKWFSESAQDNKVLKEITRGAPAIVAFSCYLWNIDKILRISGAIRKAGFKGSIILGGPEVSPRGQEVLLENPSVDIVVKGEGEQAFNDIVRRFLSGQNRLEDVPGIVLRKGEDVFENDPSPLINNLEEIPSPYLNGVVDLNTIGPQLPAFLTYRGCVLRCDYCLWGGNDTAGRVRYFSLARVERELRAIMDSNIRRVWYADSIANLNRERFKKILAIISRYNHKKVVFDFEMQAELLDEDTIDLLSRTQVGYIAFGLQSINHLVLKNINRPWNRRLFEKNIRLLQKKAKNIDVRIDLIHGLPGDTFKGYKKSFDYAMSFHPHKIQSHRLVVLPGTPMHNKGAACGMSFMRNAPHHFLESNTFSAEDCNEAKRYVDIYNGLLIQTVINQLSKCLDISSSKVFDKLLKYLKWDEKVSGRERGNKTSLERLNSFIKANLSCSRAARKYIAPFVELIRYLSFNSRKIEKPAGDAGSIRTKNASRGSFAKAGYMTVEKFQYDVIDFVDRRLFDRDATIRDMEKKTIFVTRNIRSR